MLAGVMLYDGSFGGTNKRNVFRMISVFKSHCKNVGLYLGYSIISIFKYCFQCCHRIDNYNINGLIYCM